MTRRTAAVLFLAFGLSAAPVSDLSGTWHLNVAKSRWGKHPKPISSVVTIEHHEPALKYSGTLHFQDGESGGEESRTFGFDGAIDGKEYPVTGNLVDGKMVFRRVSPNSITSDFKSNDGKVLETAKTTISADGKTLYRDMRAKGPNGEISWAEVYDRR